MLVAFAAGVLAGVAATVILLLLATSAAVAAGLNW